MRYCTLLLVCLLFSSIAYSQKLTTFENNDIYCKIERSSDDSVSVCLVNKLNESIHIPTGYFGSGVDMYGKDCISVHIGWNQQNIANVEVLFAEIQKRDTLYMIFPMPSDSYQSEVKDILFVVNYIQQSDLNQI